MTHDPGQLLQKDIIKCAIWLLEFMQESRSSDHGALAVRMMKAMDFHNFCTQREHLFQRLDRWILPHSRAQHAFFEERARSTTPCGNRQAHTAASIWPQLLQVINAILPSCTDSFHLYLTLGRQQRLRPCFASPAWTGKSPDPDHSPSCCVMHTHRCSMTRLLGCCHTAGATGPMRTCCSWTTLRT